MIDRCIRRDPVRRGRRARRIGHFGATDGRRCPEAATIAPGLRQPVRGEFGTDAPGPGCAAGRGPVQWTPANSRFLGFIELTMNHRHEGGPVREQSLSPWHPLRHRTFRTAWLAALATYLVVWMQSVGGAWYMTSLTPSPFWVAMMQTAVSLPGFFWSLPAGVLADLVDRRRLLLVTQVLMLFASGLMALLASGQWMGEVGLLFLTFLLGTGLALNAPAWQSALAEAVPREDVAQAVTLIGIAFNIARSIGPAIAGFVIVLSGSSGVFALNTVVLLYVTAVVWRWRMTARTSSLPPERLLGGMRAGLRFFVHSAPVKAFLVRTLLFSACGSALWALLPAVAHQRLGASAASFGTLIACLGLGAIAVGVLMPVIRARYTIERVLAIASVVFAITLVVVATVRSAWIVYPVLMAGGAAWTATMSKIHAGLVTTVPSWVSSRMIALYILVTQAGMAFGALLWGALAAWQGLQTTLLVSAAALLLTRIASRRYVLRYGEEREVTHSGPVEQPAAFTHPAMEAGPVAVELRYAIEPSSREGFIEAATRLGDVRRRTGATFWRLYRDLADDHRFTERFIVESWVEYQRQLMRTTLVDRDIEDAVRAFQRPGTPITTAYFLAER